MPTTDKTSRRLIDSIRTVKTGADGSTTPTDAPPVVPAVAAPDVASAAPPAPTPRATAPRRAARPATTAKPAAAATRPFGATDAGYQSGRRVWPD